MKNNNKTKNININLFNMMMPWRNRFFSHGYFAI